eukprot:3938610-Rhodomonas_salina.1
MLCPVPTEAVAGMRCPVRTSPICGVVCRVRYCPRAYRPPLCCYTARVTDRGYMATGGAGRDFPDHVVRFCNLWVALPPTNFELLATVLCIHFILSSISVPTVGTDKQHTPTNVPPRSLGDVSYRHRLCFSTLVR